MQKVYQKRPEVLTIRRSLSPVTRCIEIDFFGPLQSLNDQALQQYWPRRIRRALSAGSASKRVIRRAVHQTAGAQLQFSVLSASRVVLAKSDARPCVIDRVRRATRTASIISAKVGAGVTVLPRFHVLLSHRSRTPAPAWRVRRNSMVAKDRPRHPARVLARQ